MTTLSCWDCHQALPDQCLETNIKPSQDQKLLHEQQQHYQCKELSSETEECGPPRGDMPQVWKKLPEMNQKSKTPPTRGAQKVLTCT